MNVITVPFVRDRRLMVESYLDCYVLQSAIGSLYSGDVFPRRKDEIKRDERKVEPIAEISDGRLDLIC